MSAFNFLIEKKIPRAMGRAGVLTTPHGVINTPAFAAVGTKATVKALTPNQLHDLGAEVVLANTYHLYLEPGEKVVKAAGGLGKFMGWPGPTMTDSGGFQVFSLGAAFGKKTGKIGKESKNNGPDRPHSDVLENIRMGSDSNDFVKAEGDRALAKIDDDGVSFKSPKDGSMHRLTPERSIEIQRDIAQISSSPLTSVPRLLLRTNIKERRWSGRTLGQAARLWSTSERAELPPFAP